MGVSDRLPLLRLATARSTYCRPWAANELHRYDDENSDVALDSMCQYEDLCSNVCGRGHKYDRGPHASPFSHYDLGRFLLPKVEVMRRNGGGGLGYSTGCSAYFLYHDCQIFPCRVSTAQ